MGEPRADISARTAQAETADRPSETVAVPGQALTEATMDYVPPGRADGGADSSPPTLAYTAQASEQDATGTRAAGVSNRFGDYELLEEIARGGMGVVFKARQVSLNRVVAVKMILSGQLASKADIQRFRTEAEAAANLKHPNIVAIHEVGEHAGRHFFSMDYVDGMSLSELVLHNPLPATQAGELVRIIAEAVHHAHEQGILHRDLKPSNVLIDAAGRPHVTDFGLAKRIEGAAELTASGAVLGTPSYMPPEQALGKHAEVGRRSEVYALGAILYHLLTGRPPFRAETPIDTLHQVVHSEPAAPRLLNARVPRDLETICLKCLHKDSQRRYETAAELAEDLERFSHGDPILARPTSAWERIAKWARRHPAAAALIAVISLAVVTGVAGILFYNARLQEAAVRERRRADEARAIARETARNLIKDEFSDASMTDDPLREALLASALGTYKQLLDGAIDEPDVRFEAAQTALMLAETRRWMRTNLAREAFDDAIGRLQALAAEHPDDPKYRQHLANSHVFLGELQRDQGQFEDAARSVRTALVLQAQLCEQFSDEPDYQHEWSRSQNNLGLNLRALKQPDEAEAVYQQAIERLRALVQNSPRTVKYRAELGRAYLNLGTLLRERQQPEAAETNLNAAIASLEEVVCNQPRNREARRDLARTHNNLGNLLLGSDGRLAEAKPHYVEARNLFEHLATYFPRVPTYRLELGRSQNGLGSALARTGRRDEAAPAWKQAIDVLNQLVEDFPDVAEYHGELAVAQNNLGWLMARQRNFTDARPYLESAIESAKRALQRDSENGLYKQVLSAAEKELAKVNEQSGDQPASATNASKDTSK